MSAAVTTLLARSPVVPLAHAGEGATWQALVTVLAIGAGIVFILAVAGLLPLETPGDLVLPLAGVAILASLAPAVSDALSEVVGYAVPAGVIVLLALVLVATTGADIGWTTPLAIGTVVLAAVAAVALGAPLTERWHPQPPTLPLSDDATIEVTSDEDGDSVPAGELPLEVTVTGGTIGPPDLDPGRAPEDPEELGRVRFFVDGTRVEAQLLDPCTAESPCTSATYLVELAPGEHLILVEFVRWDGTPLSPNVADRVTLTAR